MEVVMKNSYPEFPVLEPLTDSEVADLFMEMRVDDEMLVRSLTDTSRDWRYVPLDSLYN